MITSLYIKNVAVVKELNLDLSGGFSALTGETGAGKSVIMDCIGMLIGTRKLGGKLRNGEREAIVRACFEDIPRHAREHIAELGFDAEEGITVQRSFTSDGRSTVRINGQTVTQGLAREIGAQLITIHGQNDNQRIMQRSAQLDILDSYAADLPLREEYSRLYEEYRHAAEELDGLRARSRESARLGDVYRFQLKEIRDVSPKVGEEEKLLEEEKRLQSLERIQKNSKFTYHVLRGSEKSASALISRAEAAISQLSDVIPEAGELTEKLASLRYDVEDIAERVSEWEDDGGESAPKRLDKIGSRLDSIARLRKKYGDSIEEILAFADELARLLDEIENFDALLEDAEKKRDLARTSLIATAERLSGARADAALELQERIMGELEFLEMPKVRFVISIDHLDEPTPSGMDSLEFLISANAGQPPMPMARIASGGELSRIMLAIKSILLDKDGADAVIFDEIDTGISGKTSRKVGIKLKQIARCTQVICVTHSAQIASLADAHYLISKHDIDGTACTEARLLSEDARIAEVARILGGLCVTESQLIAAKDMIDEGRGL